MPEALFFDTGGTLTGTHALHAASRMEILRPHGVEAGIPVVGLVSAHAPDEPGEAGAGLVVGDFADPAVYERLDSQRVTP